jgi:hypothetical protein
MLSRYEVEAVEGKGIRQDRRYFRQGDPGRERLRQVSLIDEGTIRRHEAVFGPLNRSLIKSQIVLAGDVFLPGLIDATLVFKGGAELCIAVEREPCFAMDLIAPGLREAMKGGHQGALAQVTRTGIIKVGQPVTVRTSDAATRGQRIAAV